MPSRLSTDSGWNCTPAKPLPRRACTVPPAGSRASSTGPCGVSRKFTGLTAVKLE